MSQYTRIYNIIIEADKPTKLKSGWSTAVGRRGGLIRKLKSGETESPGLEGTGRTAHGEGGAGTVGDRDRLKKKLKFVKGQKIFNKAHPELKKAASGLMGLSIRPR